MDTKVIQNNSPFSRITTRFLKSMGITDLSEIDYIDFSALEQNLQSYEIEKVTYELIPLRCLRHPEGEFFIYDIPMTKRLLHILASHNIYYLSRLSKYSLMEILQFRNLGAYSFQELETICKKYEVPLPS